ncbi:MAG: glycosyltransferase family 2 protein, partial [Nocardioidaceae bacterium]
MGEERVVAVVVTWNRRDLLAESLRAVLAQTRAVDEVIVIDNASDDGTDAMLQADFRDLAVVRTTYNTGGAGGFALGIAEALRRGADAVWLMDDDTVPEPEALATLMAARRGHPGRTPALAASRVVWTDGRDHPMNTPRERPGATAEQRAAAAEVGCVPIRSASFVSLLVDADAARELGLPVADYFLWNDDFEFTTRLARDRVALFCPSSVVVHKTRTFGSTDADPGERFFYEARNKVWLFGRSRSLRPTEKVLYGGATLRRWARTIAKSGDRRTLLTQLRRGVSAG